MTYSIPSLIAYDLGELRKHMLHMGATEDEWRDGLRLAIMMSKTAQEMHQKRDEIQNWKGNASVCHVPSDREHAASVAISPQTD